MKFIVVKRWMKLQNKLIWSFRVWVVLEAFTSVITRLSKVYRLLDVVI